MKSSLPGEKKDAEKKILAATLCRTREPWDDNLQRLQVPFFRGDVSVGLASECDDDVAADAAQKHGAMYEAGQLSHDQATAYNNSFDALNIHALS